MPLTVHHLNCGTMTPIGARLVNGEGGWFAPARLVSHCLLIETDDGLVLVDTGFGLRDIDEPRRRIGAILSTLVQPRLDGAETAHAQVTALGFAPSDVRHIVMTHLDSDHAGGLADFPDATVHVSPRMLATVSDGIPRRFSTRLHAAQWEHGARWAPTPMPYAADVLGLPAAPLPVGGGDLLVVPLEGHLPGHIGVAVRRSDGPTPWLIHAGDAAFSQRTFSGGKPAPGLQLFEAVSRSEKAEWTRTRRSLVELAQRHTTEVELVCSHDPGGLPTLTG